MKKSLRKYLSIERRDIWDSPGEDCHHLGRLPTARLKYMMKHRSRNDRRLNPGIIAILRERGHLPGNG